MSELLKLWRKMFPKPRWGYEYRVYERETHGGDVVYAVYKWVSPAWGGLYEPHSNYSTREEAESEADEMFSGDVKEIRRVK